MEQMNVFSTLSKNLNKNLKTMDVDISDASKWQFLCSLSKEYIAFVNLMIYDFSKITM